MFTNLFEEAEVRYMLVAFKTSFEILLRNPFFDKAIGQRIKYLKKFWP